MEQQTPIPLNQAWSREKSETRPFRILHLEERGGEGREYSLSTYFVQDFVKGVNVTKFWLLY